MRKWIAFFSFLTVCNLALAQETPEMELIDEDDHPVITIRKPDAKSELTERRDESGEIKAVKVETGVSTYYMLPKKSLGSEFDDATSRHRPAMWKIHEFDTSGQTKQTNSDDVIDYSADAPEPPPVK